MGCKFCASTIGGLERGLTPSEMLDQIYAISRDTGERVSNVVVMGTVAARRNAGKTPCADADCRQIWTGRGDCGVQLLL